jgi:hypothetical protein
MTEPSRRPALRRAGAAAAAVAVVAAGALAARVLNRPDGAGLSSGPVGSPAVAAASAADCLRRSAKVVRLTGTRPDPLYVANPAPTQTFDLRDANFVGYGRDGVYPIVIGNGVPAEATCVVGGRVVGQQPRSLTWREMITAYDGDALFQQGRGQINAVGLRADNVMDGYNPLPVGWNGEAATFELRDAHLSNIRDDCIENDGVMSGRIVDSLLDGCFTMLSERGGRNPGSVMELDGVVGRLAPMPYDTGTNGKPAAPGSVVQGRGHASLFKWSAPGGGSGRVAVSNSVFMVEQLSIDGPESMALAPGAYEGVTLVWLGRGPYPAPLPAGVRVSRDRSEWERAKAGWLRRHGKRESP